MSVDRHQVSVELSAGWCFVATRLDAHLRFDLGNFSTSIGLGFCFALLDLFLVVDDERSVSCVLAVAGSFRHLGGDHS